VKRADGSDVVWQTASVQGAELGSGQDLPVTADFVTPADAGTPGEYVLVFRGDMGEEKASEAQGFVGAVAAKVVKAPKPSSLYIAGLDATTASSLAGRFPRHASAQRQRCGGVLKSRTIAFPGRVPGPGPRLPYRSEPCTMGDPRSPPCARPPARSLTVVPSYEIQAFPTTPETTTGPAAQQPRCAGKLSEGTPSRRMEGAFPRGQCRIRHLHPPTSTRQEPMADEVCSPVTNADGSCPQTSAVIALPPFRLV